jgi:hypothetical protein
MRSQDSVDCHNLIPIPVVPELLTHLVCDLDFIPDHDGNADLVN